jgi:hypothetical protein
MSPLNAVICTTAYNYLKRGLQMILKVGYPKIISTQISEQKILMRSLLKNDPLYSKLNPPYPWYIDPLPMIF